MPLDATPTLASLAAEHRAAALAEREAADALHHARQHGSDDEHETAWVVRVAAHERANAARHALQCAEREARRPAPAAWVPGPGLEDTWEREEANREARADAAERERELRAEARTGREV